MREKAFGFLSLSCYEYIYVYVVEIYYERRRFFVAKKDSCCCPFEAFCAIMQALVRSRIDAE